MSNEFCCFDISRRKKVCHKLKWKFSVIIRWKLNHIFMIIYYSWVLEKLERRRELTIKSYNIFNLTKALWSWKSRHSWVKKGLVKIFYNNMKNDSIVLIYEASRCRKHQPEGRKYKLIVLFLAQIWFVLCCCMFQYVIYLCFKEWFLL